MIIEAQTLQGVKVTLGPLIFAEINKSINSPADKLKCTLQANGSSALIKHLKNATAFDFAGNILFTGNASAVSSKYTASGTVLSITAYGPGASLSRSEAKPQIYEHPNLEAIFRRHAMPYGIKSFTGVNKTFSRALTVTPGMSEWSVIQKFCRNYLHTQAMVTAEGILNASGDFGVSAGPRMHFCNKSGIAYSSLEHKYSRENLLSDVFARTGRSGDYNVQLQDTLSKAEGIVNRRYVNVSDDPTKTTIDAENMLSRARASSCEINIVCPGYVPAQLWKSVKISAPDLRNSGNYRITAIKYKSGIKIKGETSFSVFVN